MSEWDRQHRRTLSTFAATTVLLTFSAGVTADTRQTFDPGTPYCFLGKTCDDPALCPPPPGYVQFGKLEVLPGPTGNFARLASLPPTVEASLAFARTDACTYDYITVDFDFRMTEGGSGRADGIGFALLDTSQPEHSTSGCVFPPSPHEEPDFPGSIGVGFDIFPSGILPSGVPDGTLNHVSIHFGGAPVATFDLDPVTDIDLAKGQFIHAQIILQASVPGPGGQVTVVLTDGPTTRTLGPVTLATFSRYEGRAWFGARNGGLGVLHDVDNINVVFGRTPVPVGTEPSEIGQWEGPIYAEIVPIHAHLLRKKRAPRLRSATSGCKVLYWNRGPEPQPLEPEPPDPAEARIWKPETRSITTPAQPPFDVFCSGHSFDAEGQLFVAGGHDRKDNFGLDKASIYDPFGDAWTLLSKKMNAGRWYPTVTTLANGDLLVVSGDIEPGVVNTTPEVWVAAVGNWRPLGGAAPKPKPLYPFMFLAPNGMVFNAGPNQDSEYLSTIGPGGWIFVDNSNAGFRADGSAVMYDDGKVLIVGGNDGVFDVPTKSAEVIDLLGSAVWRCTNPMAYARRFHNATLLPDGQVLVTGGTSSRGFNVGREAVFAAEMWDPQSETWSTLASMKVNRIYHSTALLLCDGRVFVGGGGLPAPTDCPDPADCVSHPNFEIYSPPYLFKGARPVIRRAPGQITYTETFFVRTKSPKDITKVTLLRAGSVTHAFNQNQRINHLEFSLAPGGLVVTAPSDPNLCPPGDYMLFLINSKGVPSVARFVNVS